VSAPPPPDLVERRLAYYRELTRAAILDAVPDREPRRHLYDVIRAQLARAGKGLRPALCLATCAAFGGDVARAVQSAAALELLHNAFLVHDDVEDESERRRDQPTVHVAHGVPIAVNVGDAFNALSLRPLLKNVALLGPALAARVHQEVEHLLLQSLEGQAVELGWIRDNRCDVTAEDYLRMSLKKTSWYSFIHPCRIGALVATDGRIDADRFDLFGYYLGTAFQIQDDVLNLVGEAARYGKEIGGDLWEGKRTLMLVHLFEHATESERDRLRLFLGTPRARRLARDVDWVARLMARYGSIEHARGVARRMVEACERCFDEAYAGAREGEDTGFLRALVGYMTRRTV
jgi:geranylgeranyl diphosphate synthase, type II